MIKKPEKIEICMSDIRVLELMIKHYMKRGGGYSQIEALRLAIKALKSHIRLAPTTLPLLKDISQRGSAILFSGIIFLGFIFSLQMELYLTSF